MKAAKMDLGTHEHLWKVEECSSFIDKKTKSQQNRCNPTLPGGMDKMFKETEMDGQGAGYMEWPRLSLSPFWPRPFS
jgi:hypothetical protein